MDTKSNNPLRIRPLRITSFQRDQDVTILNRWAAELSTILQSAFMPEAIRLRAHLTHVAAAPGSVPDSPSWVAFTGEKGIFHFEIAAGALPLATLEHQIMLASNAAFTSDLLIAKLGSALTLDMRFPNVTRYARARSRYLSSDWTVWINYGAPTAISSGHPVDDTVPGGYNPSNPLIDQIPDGTTYSRIRETLLGQLGRRVGTHGQNLLFNFGFEDGGNFWNPGWSYPTNSANAHEGNRYCEHTYNGPTANVQLDEQVTSKYFEVTGGDKIHWGGYAYWVSGTGSGAAFIVYYYDKDKVYVGYQLTPYQTSASWALLSKTWTVPAGAKYIRVGLYHYGSSADATSRFDDVFLRILRPAEQIVEDAARSFVNQSYVDADRRPTTLRRASDDMAAGDIFRYQGAGAHDLSNVPDGSAYKRLQQGTKAARPAAGIVGRVYHAYDTDEWFRDNGASWDLIAGRSLRNKVVGTTTGPSTISGDWAVVPEMTIGYTPKTSKVLLIFCSSFYVSSAGAGMNLAPYIGGVQISNSVVKQSLEYTSGVINAETLTLVWLETGLTPGTEYTFDIRWRNLSAPSPAIYALGTARTLTVEDII